MTLRTKSKRNPVLHLVMPGLEVAREMPLPRETVTAFLRRSGWATRDRKYGWQFRKGLPTILEINGEAVLRKDWRRRRIRLSDSVRLVSYPLGGGGGGGAKQVIGLVALVAVAAFAGPLGGAIASAFSLSAGVGTVIGAGLAIGGSLQVSAVRMVNFQFEDFYNVGS
ncbi:sulfur carrier protein ThiS [Bradyrhizobium sp. LB7.2]